ncbi:hypothetical protein [Arthrobacter bambusae]|uniref:hypothetical protein n=1 Tax=Arthrobacter bambusae TaxID=1338426 RepID=UPI00278B822D|nr:hypothetical protein [Arthrobacter bambusae]MDQ0241146.1 hypothetical protein [Arthrobacter bambusae]
MAYSNAQKRKYQREWCAKNRAAYLEGKSCVHCGSAGPLEVDHIDPALKVTHSVWSWSAERRAGELAKCQTLCVPCHKAKTKAQRPTPEHGTISRYGSIYKCRCDLCRKANAERAMLNKCKKRERELAEFRNNYRRAA